MALMTVKRIGVLSLAKMQGVVMAVIGLIIGLIYGIFFMIFSAVIMSSGGRGSGASAAGGVVGGLAMMILMPIFYAVLGFGIGALSAFIYNIAARSIGGVELELENTEVGFQSSPPPPQPDSWTPNSSV
ncbi:MAG TPA: hypothetical protein VEY11_00400 [Pyrinomonadaceae bacterium]|nr:hypothetical protein [Pyrinomonadaceae bacterium]